MQTLATPLPATPWRLQDAKAQFSELVDNALRGVPQHVTRRGKQAVVVVSEADFAALQHSAARRPAPPTSFVAHLLAMPKDQADTALDVPRLDVAPRSIDFT
ncbi:MAG: type II toxin-antitoxin system prevent-host-death family antitoxin [Rhodoferax sp.]|nr:type II toxin-antitoxin system prevent-host-death family antitoxin [Rhodoferax sp.]